MKKLVCLFYAVNGAGVGHLARLLAIARWVRRYAALAGERCEIYFLTSSEATSLCFQNGFAAFKLPSKTIVRDAGISKPAYLRAARQFVFSTVTTLRPDLLVVDSFPNGSFHELLPLLDLVPRKAFVFRAQKRELTSKASFQALLPLYDRIVVPHAAGEVDVPLPKSLRRRAVWTGAVLGREREELLPRAEARARLGIPEGSLAVYASAGGGGDPGAEAALEVVLAAARGRPGTHVVVGAGPLYRGPERHGPGVTWLSRGDAPELMAGVDVAVSAGGYNAFHELLHQGVPTAFFAQAKVADAQAARVRRAREAGAALDLGASLDGASVLRALDELARPERRRQLSEAARALVPENHARDAALEVLSLVLDRPGLEEARETCSRELLAAVRDARVPFDLAAEIAGALGRGQGSDDRARERRTIERFLAANAGSQGEAGADLASALERAYGPGDEDPARELGRATVLVLERARELGLALDDQLEVLVRGVARRVKGALARPLEVARACLPALEAARAHGTAATRALLEALPPDEGDVAPLPLELALRGLVLAAGAGQGLAAAQAALVAAVAEDPGLGPVAALERAARALTPAASGTKVS